MPLPSWEQRLATVRRDWARTRPPPPPRWSADVAQERVAVLRAERRSIVGRGLWLGGAASVLELLHVDRLELPLTEVLAWFLRPDGHHGLFDQPLRYLLSLTGEDVEGNLDPVRVVLEESRPTLEPSATDPSYTRADLVVYTAHATLVIESKVYAPEQINQLDRLKRTWAGDLAPAYLFVTRSAAPQTSSHSQGAWPQVSWRDVADGFATCGTQRSPSIEALALINGLRRIW